MDNFYLDVNQIIGLMSQQDNTIYHLIPRKKIMYQAVLSNGSTKRICVSRSKFHKQINGYWVDITSIQKSVLEDCDNAVVIFLLQGMKFTAINWRELHPLLTKENMQNNTNEGNHWKMYIRDGFLEIRQGAKIPLTIIQL